MTAILSTAVSGLQAASRRLGVSAHNVANATTLAPVNADGAAPGAFVPQRVVQHATAGGVATSIRPVRPATTVVADPSSPTGLSAAPRVDLATEAVEQKLALANYRANAAVIAVQRDLDEALLDLEA